MIRFLSSFGCFAVFFLLRCTVYGWCLVSPSQIKSRSSSVGASYYLLFIYYLFLSSFFVLLIFIY